MLEIDQIDVFYGEAQALTSVSIELAPGEIVAVLGSNGAGKSTLVNSIAGIMPTRRGGIRADGVELLSLRRHEVCSAGVAIVPEGRRIFPQMTVRENLEIGAYAPGARRVLDKGMSQVHEIFPILRERTDQRAGTLSGGQQQMLAIGRALMARPRYLLLDEPSLGLAPIMVDAMFDMIEDVHAAGISVLIVEQNVARALDIAGRGYVLEEGRVVMQGSSAELRGSDQVRQAYLSV